MMRGFIAGVVAVIVVALIGGYGLLQSGLIPANADAKPGGVELWVASRSLNATLRNAAPKGPNPVALTDANLIEGVRCTASTARCVMARPQASRRPLPSRRVSILRHRS